jgi:hypothetical protein
MPDHAEVCADDASLFSALNRQNPPSTVGLLAGDLARTVSASGRSARFLSDLDVVRLPIDLGEVQHDLGTHRFASHVILRRSWLFGPILLVANAQFIGPWDVAPRSHPNDGWLDVSEVNPSMTLRQRLHAAKRLPTAGHLPHPAIRTTRTRQQSWTFRKPLDLWVDGERLGRTASVSVRCLPDAMTICI